MPYLYKKNNEIIGCSGVYVTNSEFDCVECSEEEYNKYLDLTVNKYKQIAELKQNLANTDYIANKLAETIADALVSGDNSKVYELKAEYAKQLQDRKSWRDEIDKLGG